MKINILKPTIFQNYNVIAGATETNYHLFAKGFSIFPAEIYNEDEVEYFRMILANNLNLRRENLIFQKQVHKDEIRIITKENKFLIEDSDGMITNLKNTVLNVTIADCAGVLLYDKVNQAVGAFHSGWRGTQLNIISKGIRKMIEVFNSEPTILLVWVSPCASQKNYEVGIDVASFFSEKYLIQKAKDKFLLDIRGCIRDQLINEGVKEKNIEISDICTIEDKRFHSYRRDRSLSARMSAFIGMLE